MNLGDVQATLRLATRTAAPAAAVAPPAAGRPAAAEPASHGCRDPQLPHPTARIPRPRRQNSPPTSASAWPARVLITLIPASSTE